MKKPFDILRVAVQTTGVGVGRRGCEQSSGIRFVSHVYKQMSCAKVCRREGGYRVGNTWAGEAPRGALFPQSSMRVPENSTRP